MEIKQLTKENYEEWNAFCEKSDESWFFHTTYFLDYVLEKNIQKSFMVVENKQIIGICPVIISKDEICFRGDISGRVYPLPKPALKNDLNSKSREKILKFIFEELDKIAKEHNITRVSFRFSPLEFNNYNYLMKYGFLDISLNSQVIDLSKPLETLWSEVRHGHQYAITQSSKELSIEIVNKKNISKNFFEEYANNTEEQHYLQLYDWANKNLGVLFVARSNNKSLGFTFIITYKNMAYYFSSFNNLKEKGISVNHFIQWKVINWLKENNFKSYEIGWQQYSPQIYDFPSDKEMDISLFKRGFGGETLPLFIGEKFYSEEYFKKLYKERVDKYVSTIGGKKDE